jgi:hypothetical protein
MDEMVSMGYLCIWIDKVQFVLGCLCVDMDSDFDRYMRHYA